MKKFYILLLVSLFTCLQAGAINVTTNMNPFAYGLEAILSADQQTMTVKYSLNADARTVKIVFLDGSTVLKTISCTGSLLNKTPNNVDPYISANKHSIDIPISDLPANTDLTWRIEVTGDGRAATEVYSQDGTSVYRHKFYRPSSVDIIQDPSSKEYGKVLVVESQHKVSSETGYHSSKNGNDPQGAGVYIFNPNLTPRKNGSGTYVFNGGNNSRFSNTSYSPHRVRVSDDGRIFVSSMDVTKGNILWEIGENFGSWTTVMGKGVGGATYNTSTYDLKTSGGTFIAGPNAGLDVMGSGENLKLLMLSCDNGAFASSRLGFELREYNLGTAKTWSSAPNKGFDTLNYVFVRAEISNVQYDGSGGVWCLSYRGTCSGKEPGLVHRKSNGKEDYRNTKRNNTKNAGLRFNKNYTKAIMASAGSKGHLYDYNPSEPSVYFFNEVQIDMSAVGSFLNDFAWDPANNIYAVGFDSNNSGGTGYVAMYCLPYKSTDVFSTSAPSTFSIDCNPNTQYNVIMLINDTDMGSVSGGGNFPSCSDVTVTATPNNGYRFVNWTVNGVEVSKNSSYTFSITSNISIQANFAPNVFNIEWYGLFQEHEDITDASTDTERNARLWRLFQVEYNKHAGASQPDFGESKGTSGSNRLMYYVLKFVNTNFSSYDDDSKNEVRALIEDFLDNEADKSNFYWLGQYIESVVNQEINAQEYVNIWGFYLQSFINRTKNSHNQDFSVNSSAPGTTLVGNYKVVDFSEKSKPIYWRPYWTNIACELPKTYNYGVGLPKDWNWYELPVGWSIADAANSKTIYNPCDTWCKWNNQAANPGKLLAWYYDNPANPTWPENPTIVRNVYQDGALFATWVDKLVSEELINQNNSDAIWLLNYYGESTHNIKIKRKMRGGMYNTLCLPFAATKSQQPTALQNATIMEFTGVNESLYSESGDPVVELQFTQVTDLEAGVPYLVMPQQDINDEITFTGITTGYNNEQPIVIENASTVTKSTTNGSVSFIGNIHTTNIPVHSLIVVANSRLAQVTQAGDMASMRAHFYIEDAYLQTLAAEGKVYLSMKKPVTTSIPVAPEAEQQRKPEVRKIMRNGQIYIIRDGITYTITGARVR